MLIILFILIIILYLLACFYLVKKMYNFSIIKKIKNKLLAFLISILPILLIMLIFDYINAFIIIIHLIIFSLISELIVKIIFKRKKLTFALANILTIILTILYLGIGAYQDFHVYETHYNLETKKELGQDNLRIIQISDSHIGATFDGDGFYKHIEKISQIPCDIVVITGDFVDDDTTKEDMLKSLQALKLLNPKYGTYFIYGNHDKGYFNYRNFQNDELKDALRKANVKILEDEVVEINEYIYLIGRQDKEVKNRKTIQELTNNLDKMKYIIDLNHQPNDYQNEMNNVDLVLSGHSHGGQLFPLGYIGLLMSSNDEFYGLHTRGKTNFIVNSGISDWKIIFKTGTFSEYGIIDIKRIDG